MSKVAGISAAEEKASHPEEKASWFSQFLITWANPLVNLARNRQLNEDDVWESPSKENVKIYTSIFWKSWDHECATAKTEERPASLLKALLNSEFGRQFMIAGIYQFVFMSAQIAQPFIVSQLVYFISSQNDDLQFGIGLALALFAVSLLSSACLTWAFNILRRNGVAVRCSVMMVVYEHSLRLTTSSRLQNTVGQITNLMAIDSEKLFLAVNFMHFAWHGPLASIIVMCLLIRSVGVGPAMMGLASQLALIPVQNYLAAVSGKIRRDMVKDTDTRVKLMNELLQSIRVVKLYAWESPMEQRIMAIRAKELRRLNVYLHVTSILREAIFASGPISVSVIIASIVYWFQQPLSVPQIFEITAFLNILRLPTNLLGQALKAYSDAMVSINRLNRFLLLPTVQDQDGATPGLATPGGGVGVGQRDEGALAHIQLHSASFRWDTHGAHEFVDKGPPPPVAPYSRHASVEGGRAETQAATRAQTVPRILSTFLARRASARVSTWGARQSVCVGSSTAFELHNVTFATQSPTELVGVIGSVGSGKSSLMSALLKEMPLLSGQCTLQGRVAYCAQTPWIQNLTLRDNVLFGLKYDDPGVAKAYERAIDAAALRPDISILPDGDRTEIGEKGINLSGGQKARVSIARAILAATANRANVVLLDDPFSAVDGSTGNWIFEHGVLDCLRGTIRVIVLNSHRHLLRRFDRVLILSNGEVVAAGHPSDLAVTHGELLFGMGGGGTAAGSREALPDLAQDAKEPHTTVTTTRTPASVTPSVTQTHLGRDRDPRPGFNAIAVASATAIVPPAPSKAPNATQTQGDGSSTRAFFLRPWMGGVPRGGLSLGTQLGTGTQSGTGPQLGTGTPLRLVTSPREVTGAPSGSLRAKARNLIVTESRKAGSVSLSVYSKYFAAATKKDCTADPTSQMYAMDSDAVEAMRGRALKEAPAAAVAVSAVCPERAGAGVKASNPAASTKMQTQTQTPLDRRSRINGFLIAFGLFVLFTASQVSRVAIDYCLAMWASDSRGTLGSFWETAYWVSIAILIGFLTVRSTYLNCFAFLSAKQIHGAIFRSVICAPITTFYDTHTVGMVLNRFAKDTEIVDSTVPEFLLQLLTGWTQVLSIFALCLWSTPYFAIVMFPMALAFVQLFRQFSNIQQDLKRLESVSRSPMFSSLSETLSGLETIRAYGATDRFLMTHQARMDFNHKFFWTFWMCTSWVTARLEMATTMVLLAVAVLAVCVNKVVSPVTLGLALSYSLMLTALFQRVVQVTIDMSVYMTSAERVMEYLDIEPEPNTVRSSESDSAPTPSSLPPAPVPSAWPAQGVVEFKKVWMQYRDNPPVLRGISFVSRAGERIGICGRTGAGKSSLAAALFRVTPLRPGQGQILLDGVDVQSVPLQRLRSSLAIIPQDPVLFTGSIRFQLDPFGQYSDDALWTALAQVNMAAFVRAADGKLEEKVLEGGENLSQGQRQLICIARALLRKARVMVMDEGTSAVDPQTDELVQKVLKESATREGTTVLTIAHRLDTILDFDRILVLGNGEVLEFDAPQVLLANSNSVFASMMREQEKRHA